MHTKMKYGKLMQYMLLLCIVLDFPWTRLIASLPVISSFASIYDKELLIIIGCVAAAVIDIKYKRVLSHYRFAKRYVVFVFLCTLLVMLLSAFEYRAQGLRETYISGHQLFIIILVPVYLFSFEYRNGYHKILKWLLIYAYAWSLITLLQSVLYMVSGYQFLAGINYEWSGFLSIKLLRISLIAIPNVMLVYVISELLQKKYTIWNTLYFVLASFCVLFVQQTRAYIAAIALAGIAMFAIRSHNSLKFLRNIIVLVILLLLLFRTDYVQSILQSFSDTGVKGGSSLARSYAYGYYLQCFFNNPLYGNGFTSSVRYPEIQHGNGAAYYSDCGVVGLIAQMGIFGVLICGIYLWRMISIVWYLKKKKCLQKNLLVVGLTVYTIMTSFTLAYTTPALSMMFPLCLAWIEYLNRNAQFGNTDHL